MRLASFNTRGGRAEDGRVDPERTVAAIGALDADVLALQEVDRHQARSGGVDQAMSAAVACGVDGRDHVRFEPALWGTPGTTTTSGVPGPPGDPSYGVALISRLPVRAWRRVDLPHTRAAVPVPLAGLRPGRRPPVTWMVDEPRVALAAVLDEPAPVATVVTTHLSFLPGVNAVQLRRLAAALRDLPSPLLLLGDFNLPAPVPRLLLGRHRGWRPLPAAPTFPAHRPRLHLDQALLRGPLPDPVTTWTVRAGVSDHRVLVVEVGVSPRV